MTEADVRELTTTQERTAAVPILQQLRPDLTEQDYEALTREMDEVGYRLFGLFDDDVLRAVAGVDVRMNLDDGRHLWLHELVTDERFRSRGYGASLLSWVYQWGREADCNAIALSSSFSRTGAHRFYEEKTNLQRTGYTFKDVFE